MNESCRFYFHDTLNDFLLRRQKGQWLVYQNKHPSSLKDVIEAIGIPHVEVLKVVVNGNETSINELVRPGNSVEVFPYQEHFSETAPKAFILDVHLGKLARLLRMLGIDCYYGNNLSDHEIVTIAMAQKRAVLTRDIGLLKHKVLAYGYWLRSQHPEEQLAEVIRRFSLCPHLQPFSRCMACNGLLQTVPKEDVLASLPPQTKEYFSEFYRCSQCRRVYWKGSHYENMEQLVQRIRSVAC